MKYIKKLWLRILISLFAGSMTAELVHLSRGEINTQSSSLLLWIFAGIIFGILSLIVWFDKYRYYFFPEKTDNEDILDEID